MEDNSNEINFDFIDFEYYIELELYNKRYKLKVDNK